MNELPTTAAIAALIDHAILKPELDRVAVLSELEVAKRYSLFSVCVRPSDIPFVVAELSGTGVATGTVIGFPHGTTSTAGKVAEVKQALADGAVEFDMVINIGWLKSGLHDEVREDIRAVVEAAAGHVTKVILETALLSDDEVSAGSRLSEEAGATFVKTSTGFAGGGATAQHLQLMRAAVSEATQLKASGGVRSLDTLLEFQKLGVTRFGTSSSAAILDELAARRDGKDYSADAEGNTGY